MLQLAISPRVALNLPSSCLSILSAGTNSCVPPCLAELQHSIASSGKVEGQCVIYKSICENQEGTTFYKTRLKCTVDFHTHPYDFKDDIFTSIVERGAIGTELTMEGKENLAAIPL